jgi:hypothetical protein
MKAMASSSVESADLLDLKLLPAWVKEPMGAKHFQHYAGDGQKGEPRNRPRHRDHRHRPPITCEPRHRAHGPKGWSQTHAPPTNQDPHITRTPPQLQMRFLPHPVALENVVAQIKSQSLAYSLVVLARLFLEKPGRYEVCLKTSAETPLYRLGEDGAFSLDREYLERDAFRFACPRFYRIDVTLSDPIKGNFSNVARCRFSGMLLGPTNYHTYQAQLRSLYEQRFSRRMSFADYQRQIEILNDPALIERWKEEARKVTTYTTLRETTPVTYSSAADAERHFRANYLPGLIRTVQEITISAASSRSLPDKLLYRAVERAWAQETRSPSNMMQELAARFRRAGLHVFRHRRGMLFVSPIRVRPFIHDQAGTASIVKAILETVAASPGIRRKELCAKIIPQTAAQESESRELALACDLRWLIDEGYVIEFNDGSLDLPRAKSKPAQPLATPAASAGEPVQERQVSLAGAPDDPGDLELGGS